jgi:hypothetical protein
MPVFEINMPENTDELLQDDDKFINFVVQNIGVMMGMFALRAAGGTEKEREEALNSAIALLQPMMRSAYFTYLARFDLVTKGDEDA